MAVAASVRDGGADAGLGIFSAAKAMELDFIPIGEEEYDFAAPTEFLEQLRTFIEALTSEEFHAKLKELGGYTAKQCGKLRHLN
jgi:putative molybdopterin biosynthesis protein